MPPKRSKKGGEGGSSSGGAAEAVVAEVEVEEEDANDNFGYCKESYWDDRYKDEKGYLEWYFSFDQLKGLIDPYVVEEVEAKGHKELRVLESGCGDAPLLFGFWDAYKEDHSIASLQGIDYADSVVKLLNSSEKLLALNGSKNAVTGEKGSKKISFTKMDARHMDFSDAEFNIIFDKGTIDAMLCSDQGFEDVNNLFHEYCRVLMNGGKVVVISHMRPDSDNFQDFLEMCVYPAFEYRSDRHWTIDAHIIASEDKPVQTSSRKRAVVEEEEEAEEGPTVYIFSPSFRRITRVSNSYDPFIDFQLHEH